MEDNKMRTFTVKVSDKAVDYIERLSYELEGMKAILKEIITDAQDNPLVLEGAGFKAYNAKYEERHAKYEAAKQEIQNQFLPQELVSKNMINKWNLEYSTGILTFETPDENYKPTDSITEVK